MNKLLVLLVFACSLHGQDVEEILRRHAGADKVNEERAARYTYVENATYYSYDKKGALKKERTETSDVIFVEGETYKRLIARDGKPLSAKDAAKEEKKMRQTAEQRREARRKARRKGGLFSRTVYITRNDLATLLDHRLAGEEEVRGRKAWIVEFTPPPGRIPKNQHEKDVLATKWKMWVDQGENVTVKMRMDVVGDGSFWKPGTTMEYASEKINDDAWLTVSAVWELRFQIAKVMKNSSRSETVNSNFKKFDVESTITVDEIKP